MSFLIGIVLAVAISASATGVGFDRDRALYPVIMIVIASFYALFAIMADSPHALLVESIVAATFIAASVAGFRSSLWIVVVALGAHGVFDLLHAHLIDNRGVPVWWPSFCLTYDVAAAGYLAWLLVRQRVPARNSQGMRR